jgi:hypothetical protein
MNGNDVPLGKQHGTHEDHEEYEGHEGYDGQEDVGRVLFLGPGASTPIARFLFAAQRHRRCDTHGSRNRDRACQDRDREKDGSAAD